MSLTNEERNAIVQKELERAHETFEEIEVMRQAQRLTRIVQSDVYKNG